MARGKKEIGEKEVPYLEWTSNKILSRIEFSDETNGSWYFSVPDCDVFYGNGIGFDPGKWYGLAVVNRPLGVITTGEFSAPDSLNRGIAAYDLARERFAGQSLPVVIEGPSFGDKYGREDLERVRFGFYLGMVVGTSSESVEMVPPDSVRKAVFGRARLYGTYLWKVFDSDKHSHAADALACALYAAGWRARE